MVVAEEAVSSVEVVTPVAVEVLDAVETMVEHVDVAEEEDTVSQVTCYLMEATLGRSGIRLMVPKRRTYISYVKPVKKLKKEKLPR